MKTKNLIFLSSPLLAIPKKKYRTPGLRYAKPGEEFVLPFLLQDKYFLARLITKQWKAEKRLACHTTTCWAGTVLMQSKCTKNSLFGVISRTAAPVMMEGRWSILYLCSLYAHILRPHLRRLLCLWVGGLPVRIPSWSVAVSLFKDAGKQSQPSQKVPSSWKLPSPLTLVSPQVGPWDLSLRGQSSLS